MDFPDVFSQYRELSHIQFLFKPFGAPGLFHFLHFGGRVASSLGGKLRSNSKESDLQAASHPQFLLRLPVAVPDNSHDAEQVPPIRIIFSLQQSSVCKRCKKRMAEDNAAYMCPLRIACHIRPSVFGIRFVVFLVELFAETFCAMRCWRVLQGDTSHRN